MKTNKIKFVKNFVDSGYPPFKFWECFLHSFTGFYFKYRISVQKTAKITKTGNYNDDTKAHIGRYVSFWNHGTPASLLLNNNPVLSNTLMLQASLYVLAAIASGKRVKLFPDIYYASAIRESVFDRQR